MERIYTAILFKNMPPERHIFERYDIICVTHPENLRGRVFGVILITGNANQNPNYNDILSVLISSYPNINVVYLPS